MIPVDWSMFSFCYLMFADWMTMKEWTTGLVQIGLASEAPFLAYWINRADKRPTRGASKPCQRSQVALKLVSVAYLPS